MNIAAILQRNYPGEAWSLDGNEYAGLQWLSDSPKPTKAALEKAWPEVAYRIEFEAVQAARQAAYQRDADPLFFGWQRGDNTEKAWLDAVAAVKAAHPYPEAA